MLRTFLLAIAVALAAPAAALASPAQIAIMQDDPAFMGESPHDPDAAMAEAHALGVDVVRVFVVWNRVAPAPTERTMPAGFDPGDPDSPGYDWSAYDRFVDRAKAHGLRVFLTLSPEIPYWASEEPSGCPHHVGGYAFLALSCMWKPSPHQFGQFAHAVARRYGSVAPGPHGGAVDLYSMWNEPNLEHYLLPQTARLEGRRVDVAARRYRSLWLEGWKAISISDPPRRDRVLFGETAAISSPLDTLYAALCLDERGRPFRGRLRRLQRCKRRPGRLPIGGIAIHPYNNHATGGVFTRSLSGDSHAVAYVSRLHHLLDRAARLGRIPRRRGIYITEFGFQSNPPDIRYGLSPERHAAALNDAERLYFGDRRVRSISQFELFDSPAKRDEPATADVYTTGLRALDGTPKPALEAFRLPLVVTRLGRDAVEVWGGVRNAEGPTIATVTAARRSGGFRVVRRTRTNGSGYFRLRVPAAGRSRWRIEWRSPGGRLFHSSARRAGRRIRYLEAARP